MRKYLWLSFIIDFILIDQASKWVAMKTLETGREIIPGVLSLNIALNKGIAWGVPIPNLIMILAAPLLLGALIFVIVRNCNVEYKTTKIAILLIASGAIGNLIDRIFRGGVIDFIDFSFWPNFNLADAFLTLGVFLIIAFYGRITRTNSYGS